MEAWHFPHKIVKEYVTDYAEGVICVVGGITEDSDGNKMFRWELTDGKTGYRDKGGFNIKWCRNYQNEFYLEDFFHMITGIVARSIIGSRKQTAMKARGIIQDFENLLGASIIKGY